MNRLRPVIPPLKKRPVFEIEPDEILTINRGTGAGGANTNKYGKAFEKQLSQEERLLQKGFQKVIMNTTKFGYYLKHSSLQRDIYFFQQSGLSSYLKLQYNITINRYPDEAYLICNEDGTTKLKIIEMKHQNVSGSVDIKLWAAPTLKREYQFIVGDKMKVEYALSVSEFLEKKFLNDSNFKILYHHLFKEDDIRVFFANHSTYAEEVNKWIQE